MALTGISLRLLITPANYILRDENKMKNPTMHINYFSKMIN